MRAAIYCRVSTEEQLEGYSIDAQLDACRKLVRDRGWTIAVEYVEPGESGKTFEQRPQWQALMRSARAGRFDVLVCHKIDRFSRATILDSLGALEELRSHKISFVSASEPIDFAGPHGELMLVLFLWFARHYLTNLSAEVSKGLRKRVESGRSNANRPPFGYLRNADGDDVPDPATRDLAAKMFQQFLQGVHSDRDVARWLNAQGAKTVAGHAWTPEAVREILINPFYAGWVKHRPVREPLSNLRTKRKDAKLTRGVHEPLVDQSTFDRVQAIRKARFNRTGGPPTKHRVYLLQGLARCSKCGQRMKASASGGGRLQYSCRAGEGHGNCEAFGKMVYERDLIPQVEAALASMRLSDRVVNRAEQLIGAEDSRDKAMQRRSEIVSEQKRLDHLFLKGRVTQSAYDREMDRLEAELTLLEPTPIVTADEAGAVLTGLLDAWRAAGDDRVSQRDILRAIFESVEIDSGQKRIVKMTPRPEFMSPLKR